jgi:hypothetical protein
MQRLLYITKKSESLFALVGFVSQAQDDNSFFVYVVKEKLVQLKRLHCIWLNAWH